MGGVRIDAFGRIFVADHASCANWRRETTCSIMHAVRRPAASGNICSRAHRHRPLFWNHGSGRCRCLAFTSAWQCSTVMQCIAQSMPFAVTPVLRLWIPIAPFDRRCTQEFVDRPPGVVTSASPRWINGRTWFLAADLESGAALRNLVDSSALLLGSFHLCFCTSSSSSILPISLGSRSGADLGASRSVAYCGAA
jgi:hypothetical protein